MTKDFIYSCELIYRLTSKGRVPYIRMVANIKGDKMSTEILLNELSSAQKEKMYNILYPALLNSRSESDSLVKVRKQLEVLKELIPCDGDSCVI